MYRIGYSTEQQVDTCILDGVDRIALLFVYFCNYLYTCALQVKRKVYVTLHVCKKRELIVHNWVLLGKKRCNANISQN